MTKIAYIHGNSNIIAGQEKILLNIVREIKKSDFEPVVILPCDGVFAKELSNLRITVKFIKLHRLNKKNPFLFLSTIFQLYIYLKKEEIKLLHISGVYPNQYSCFAAKLAGIPIICHIHSTVYKKEEFNNSFLSFADFIIAVSNGVRDNIKKTGIIKKDIIKVIYNGIAPKDYYIDEKRLLRLKKEFNFDNKYILIGQIGQIIERKGIFYFIKMAEHVIKHNQNVRFFLIGDDKYEPGYMSKMKNLVNDLKLNDYFIFTGFRNEIHELISLLDIVILSSLFEGLPTILLEAMLLSKPVIATDIPGVNEIIEDKTTGFLVPARDHLSLARQVLMLLSNREQINIQINNAKKKVLVDFSLEKQITQLTNIYNNLINK